MIRGSRDEMGVRTPTPGNNTGVVAAPGLELCLLPVPCHGALGPLHHLTKTSQNHNIMLWSLGPPRRQPLRSPQAFDTSRSHCHASETAKRAAIRLETLVEAKK